MKTTWHVVKGAVDGFPPIVWSGRLIEWCANAPYGVHVVAALGAGLGVFLAVRG